MAFDSATNVNSKCHKSRNGWFLNKNSTSDADLSHLWIVDSV